MAPCQVEWLVQDVLPNASDQVREVVFQVASELATSNCIEPAMESLFVILSDDWEDEELDLRREFAIAILAHCSRRIAMRRPSRGRLWHGEFRYPKVAETNARLASRRIPVANPPRLIPLQSLSRPLQAALQSPPRPSKANPNSLLRGSGRCQRWASR